MSPTEEYITECLSDIVDYCQLFHFCSGCVFARETSIGERLTRVDCSVADRIIDMLNNKKEEEEDGRE